MLASHHAGLGGAGSPCRARDARLRRGCAADGVGRRAGGRGTARYGEIWGDMGRYRSTSGRARYGEIWGDRARYGEIWVDEREGEVWRDMGRYGEKGEIWVDEREGEVWRGMARYGEIWGDMGRRAGGRGPRLPEITRDYPRSPEITREWVDEREGEVRGVRSRRRPNGSQRGDAHTPHKVRPTAGTLNWWWRRYGRTLDWW